MIRESCDTNILLHAVNSDSPHHLKAARYLSGRGAEFAICELVLLELYVLLRNPAILPRPLPALQAVRVCERFRSHPLWGIIDYPGPLARLMDRVWACAGQPDFARRRVFDARLALTVAHHGVDEFATQNVKDFQGFGLRAFDPLT